MILKNLYSVRHCLADNFYKSKNWDVFDAGKRSIFDIYNGVGIEFLLFSL